jgi:2-succinyl-5-enolpyruvyl-6-hydroxy-3-cyclohexene-1-carboxylate synthase
MKNDTGALNELWTRLIIKELIHHGIRSFCISPGARSTPLTIAAATHPLSETFVHYDERGMAYHALGYAKGSRQPVALIVTSGTAVGNLLPAIMEAHHDHVPLIVLSADRPPELRDCGANQATDQVKIFSNFVKWQGDLPCPDSKISQSYIGTTIAQAMSHALSGPKGPVHLNCMFRKPFLDLEDSAPVSLHLSSRSVHSAETTLSLGKTVLAEATLERIADELSEYEKGLILVSESTPFDDVEQVYSLSRALQWPIFPDIFSSVRSNGSGYGVIPHYDLLLKAIGAHEDYTPEAILQLGDRFVSSKLTDWIASKKPKVHCHISPHSDRKDPVHSVTHRASSDLNHFLDHFPRYFSGRSPSKWFEIWKELNQLTKKGIKSYFIENNGFSEPLLFHSLKNNIPTRAALFFSNSMNARNGDAFFTPEEPVGPIFGNRGLSGIDGNIATIAGIARGSGKPVVAFVGDLAFLHDLNSLAQLKNLPVKLIIVNNNGGDIFNFLPIGEEKELFTTPQNHLLKHAAPLFDLPYENPQTLDDLAALLRNPGPLVIEVNTLQGQNLAIHKDLLSNLQEIPSRVTPAVSC